MSIQKNKNSTKNRHLLKVHEGDVHAYVLELMNRKTCQLQPQQMMKKVHSTHLRATLVYFFNIILIEKLTVSTCRQSSAISCLLSSRTSGIEDSASRELPAVK